MRRLALILIGLAGSAFAQTSDELLTSYCGSCHSGDEPKGGFALEDLEFAPTDEAWWGVAERIADSSMPPPKAEQPSDAERAKLLAWIEAEHPRPKATLADLPAPPIRRYNRTELTNILFDVFGIRVEPERLMIDEIGDGFDTHAGMLSWNDIALERWFELAEWIADRTIQHSEELQFEERTLPAEQWRLAEGTAARGDVLALYTRRPVAITVPVRTAGSYRLEAFVRGQRAGDALPEFEFLVNGKVVFERAIEAEDEFERVEHFVDLEVGDLDLSVRFPNDYYQNGNDRNLYVRSVKLIGPLDEPELTPFQERYLADDDRSFEEVARAFLPTLWRRPVSKDDVRRLGSLSAKNDPLVDRVCVAVVGALTSPRFHTLGLNDDAFPQHALADRMAALLWNSSPDEELLAAADDERLASPDTLARQVRRMLGDVRSTAFAHDFVVQWLQLRALDEVMPDPRVFPFYDEALASSMRRETELFFEALIRERRPLREILLADFTFVDGKLAEHYGLRGVDPEEHMFRRVAVNTKERSGVLGHASVLTVTSNPTRTSPVLRGKWVLEAILDAPPKPPPADAANLASVPKGEAAPTLRERLEAHRDDAECAACHAALDPLGFALENFDAIGSWRTHDVGLPVDASGELPDGRSFAGARELAFLLSQGDTFVRAFTQRLAVYALGRSLVPADELWIDPLVESWRDSEPTVEDVLVGIVSSPAFLPHSVR